MAVVFIEMIIPSFLTAADFNADEITAKFKAYDETMGGDEGWNLKRDKNGIKVYHRKTSLTPINVFKGETEVETDLSTMCAFLMDVYNFPSWVLMCDSIEALVPVNEDVDDINQVVYCLYSINKPPRPVMPRDNVIYAVVTQDPDTLTLRVKSVSLPELIPHKKGFVRCPMLMVEMKLRPLDNGNIEFSFETSIDPGGWIPAWVINLYAVEIPYKTLLNIKKHMPFKEKYKQKKIKWLKVPPITSQ